MASLRPGWNCGLGPAGGGSASARLGAELLASGNGGWQLGAVTSLLSCLRGPLSWSFLLS